MEITSEQWEYDLADESSTPFQRVSQQTIDGWYRTYSIDSPGNTGWISNERRTDPTLCIHRHRQGWGRHGHFYGGIDENTLGANVIVITI